jgi:2-polyprenyl-6-methoxyphenol hydroxylase-like FAD-dependent oxidoreductase
MLPLTSTKCGNHAIVIGGSIVGLFATRILSDYFESVTLIEQDFITEETREYRGIPQSRHAHVLLAKGFEIASQLFTDLEDSLRDAGAIEIDIGEEVSWYHFSDYKIRFKNSLKVWCQSRPLLESVIRQRIAQLSNVTILSKCAVERLLTAPNKKRILGVKLGLNRQSGYPSNLTADLVIDATGRNSHGPQWLESLGYRRPEESEVIVKVGYTSRIYKRNSQDFDKSKFYMISGHPPIEKRGGLVAPIEGDRWLVTLIGYLDDHPPIEDKGFLEFTRSLAVSDIYDLITRSEPLSEPIPHKFPSSLRRHYERLEQFPEGYLLVGDALCSFNPIFGQGMTVAALEAHILSKCLSENLTNLQGLSQQFFSKVARIIDTPWSMAMCEDIRYPEVSGKRTLKTSALNWYIGKIYEASHRDSTVYDAFLQVMHLMSPPQILFKPPLLWRVLKASILFQPTVLG